MQFVLSFYLYEQYVKQTDGAIGHKTFQYWREIADDHISFLFFGQNHQFEPFATLQISGLWHLNILPSW